MIIESTKRAARRQALVIEEEDLVPFTTIARSCTEPAKRAERARISLAYPKLPLGEDGLTAGLRRSRIGVGSALVSVAHASFSVANQPNWRGKRQTERPTLSPLSRLTMGAGK